MDRGQLECRYCGKKLGLRTRHTGETSFCSAGHRQLFQDEHSRLGLARLLEEVSPVSAPEPASPEPPDYEEHREENAGWDVDEPGRAWIFPPLPFAEKPQFRETIRLRLSPSEYVAGRPAPAAKPGLVAPTPRIVATLPSAQARVQSARKPATALLDVDSPAGAVVEERPIPAPVTLKVTAPAPKKVERIATKPGASKTTQRASKPVVQSPPTDDSKATDTVPFGALAQSPPGRMSMFKLAAIGAVLATAGFLGVALMSSDHRGTAEALAVPAGGEWISGWAKGPGGEGIALFGPSQEWSDYRAETRVNRYVGLTWVFRATDEDNCYVVKLSGGRQANSMNLIRYALINGRQQEFQEVPVPARATADDTVGVQLEVRGSRFRLFVEGEMSAVWSDRRHGRGGFGVEGGGDYESSVRVSQL